jgi:heme oxygenase
MTSTPVAPVEGLAAALREGTKQAHEQAEGTSFVGEMSNGRVTIEAVADYHAQLYTVYSALEVASDAMLDAPVAGKFADQKLNRVPALEADLEHMLGAEWRDKIRVLPATEEYRARVVEVCSDSEQAFLAHHYTRYLGDLSGGRIVGSMLNKHYGLTTEAGLAFYDFPLITEPVPYKRAYRDNLNSVPWDEAQIAATVEESLVAFRLNTAVFEALGALHVTPAGE